MYLPSLGCSSQVLDLLTEDHATAERCVSISSHRLVMKSSIEC
jgi:hypothetical protein